MQKYALSLDVFIIIIFIALCTQFPMAKKLSKLL